MRCSAIMLLMAAAATALGPCESIGGPYCALPFPNDFWRRDGRLALNAEMFPKDTLGQTTDPAAGGWNTLDGFSALASISSVWPGISVNASRLAPHWNIAQSLDRDSSSIILDTMTGQLVAHWSELDSGEGFPASGDRLLMTWPASRLRDSRRYIVAYRNLVDSNNRPLSSSVAFSSLRDNVPSADPDIESRRAHFETIFAALERVGVARRSVQLAWDFTTNSREAVTGKLVSMRDDAFARTAGELIFSIDSFADAPDDDTTSNIYRTIRGYFLAPQYVNSPFPGANLVLDRDGLPVYQGMAPAYFFVQVPRSLAEKPTADGTILQYGHGLFGSREEAKSSYLQAQANAQRAITISVDWIGLAAEDEVPVAAMMATNLTQFRMIPERCMQGVLQALLLMRLVKQPNFQKHPAMLFTRDHLPVIGPTSQTYYYGNSQGGILGAVYMAVTPDVKRGTLGVGGGPYSLLLPRSHDFATLAQILRLRFPNAVTYALLLGFFQLLWDRADPGGYASAVVYDPLPRTHTHEVLAQHGLGDAQVSYLGTYAIARSMNASIFSSNINEPNEKPFGLRVVPDNAIINGAGMVTWRFPGVPPAPRNNTPPDKATDVHEWPRRQASAQAMMWNFFKTGDIRNYCNGPCDGTRP